MSRVETNQRKLIFFSDLGGTSSKNASPILEDFLVCKQTPFGDEQSQ